MRGLKGHRGSSKGSQSWAIPRQSASEGGRRDPGVSVSSGRKVGFGTWELAHLVKCLPHRHWDLSWVPTTHMKEKFHKVVHSCAVEGETGGNPGACWLASLAN